MEFIAPTVLIFLLISLLICLSRHSAREAATRSFEKRFPPISDAEFVARCTPGADPDIALRVRRIVVHRLGVEYERIYPSTRFVDDLGAD